MNFKKAFSLTEIVLVMGIIGVITAMGVSITKINMGKAYNHYWYTGYINLWNTTLDAVGTEAFNPDAPILSNYGGHICGLMNSNNAQTLANGSVRCTAPNGIGFVIAQGKNNLNYYKITMTIPSPRQRAQVKNTTDFIYNFDSNSTAGGLLYPASGTSSNGVSINLHNRPDLLPFYIKDDSNPNSPTNEFWGFHDAFCKIKNSVRNMEDANITCNSGPSGSGVIIPISPRRAF